VASVPFVELKGITKRFPGVFAYSGVNLAVERGEIHALVGENGAGKTTLMRILYGLYQPDEGQILIQGMPARIESPRAALSYGIGMVHQNFMLIPRFTVTESVILGNEPIGPLGRLQMTQAQHRVRALCAQYGFALDPTAVVGALSVGEQQRVEIIKVLYRGAELLILDEPTAVLAPQEAEELFANLRTLRAQGKTIVFISHRLDEVLAIADRITVMRRGQVIATTPAAGMTKARLAETMVGRPVLLELSVPPMVPGEVRLEARGLSTAPVHSGRTIRGISLAVRSHEIYGIAGVEGNGQSELVEALVGLRPIGDGSLLIDGTNVTHYSTRDIRLLGVAHIPEDRHRRGLVLPLAVWENGILGHHYRDEFVFRGLLNRLAIDAFVRREITEFDIRVTGPDLPAFALSGGNQQKLIIAREFSFSPKVLIAAQPTRGLDIGATEFVERRLLEARAAGMGVLLVSANLEEVLTLADRVGVMYGGELVAEFPRGVASPTELGLYMTGTKRSAEIQTG
jgi:simple sugar transport system ATP-binding protein